MDILSWPMDVSNVCFGCFGFFSDNVVVVIMDSYMYHRYKGWNINTYYLFYEKDLDGGKREKKGEMCVLI